MKKRTALLIALALVFALSLSVVSNATQIHKKHSRRRCCA